VSSHYLDKPAYPTVLDYYRARVLDETTRRRCQDRNGTVVRACTWPSRCWRWLRAPKGAKSPTRPIRTMTKREWTARPEM
jgi:hypothetical protein